MSRALPASKDVKDLLEDLLGRSITVSPADPVRSSDLPKTHVSLYVDDGLHLAAVVGLDLALAVYCGAAIGLVPVGGAKDCVDEGKMSPMLAENIAEICNVFSGLINRPGMPHVRMYQTFLPGKPPPADAAGFLLAIGRRLDLTVDVAGYGAGRFAIALAN
jgi:hypothetical protein